MKDAEPKAKHPKQENRTETSKDGPEDVRGQRETATEGRGRCGRRLMSRLPAWNEKGKQNRTPPKCRKPRRTQSKVEKTAEEKESTDRQAEMSCKQQSKGSATETSGEGKSFQYVCPACHKSVRSSIRTGQVDHRRACGNRFQVWDAQVVAKGYVYICPACTGNVSSDVKTGQIDHRTVCGKQFSVKDGVVQEKAYVYICPACKGNVASDVKTGKIDHRIVCGNQFSVKDGVCAGKSVCLHVPRLQRECGQRRQDKGK